MSTFYLTNCVYKMPRSRSQDLRFARSQKLRNRCRSHSVASLLTQASRTSQRPVPLRGRRNAARLKSRTRWSLWKTVLRYPSQIMNPSFERAVASWQFQVASPRIKNRQRTVLRSDATRPGSLFFVWDPAPLTCTLNLFEHLDSSPLSRSKNRCLFTTSVTLIILSG